MRMIFNKDTIALQPLFYNHHIVIPIDLETMCFTPYGAFIPMEEVTHCILNVLNDKMPRIDLYNSNIYGALVRITAGGDVSVVVVDTYHNTFTEYPVTSTQWITFGLDTTNRSFKSCNIAYDYLLRHCKTIEQAIKRVEHTSAQGLFEPLVIDVKAVANRLQDLKFNKSIMWSNFFLSKTT